MKVGKFGVSYKVYAMLAFGLMIINIPYAMLILALFVMFVDRDEWALRMISKALILDFLFYLANLAIIFLGSLLLVIPFIGMPILLLTEVLNIIRIVVAFLCIYRLSKNEEPKILIVDAFADWLSRLF